MQASSACVCSRFLAHSPVRLPRPQVRNFHFSGKTRQISAFHQPQKTNFMGFLRLTITFMAGPLTAIGLNNNKSKWHNRTPTHGLASVLQMCTAISPGQWQPWTSVCHCPGDMAVRMRKVLCRPWVGVRVCHLLLLLSLWVKPQSDPLSNITGNYMSPSSFAWPLVLFIMNVIIACCVAKLIMV